MPIKKIVKVLAALTTLALSVAQAGAADYGIFSVGKQPPSQNSTY